MKRLMKQAVFLSSQMNRRACTFGLALASIALTTVTPAWAFDQAGYQVRLDATRAELVKKTLADSKATLARLDEIIALGIVASREYGAKSPKYAKLMEAVIASAPSPEYPTRPFPAMSVSWPAASRRNTEFRSELER